MFIDVVMVPEELKNGALRTVFESAVVIDVLRATSTIVTAIANGAVEVKPVVGLEEAVAHKPKGYLVCGEVGSLKPREFDLGNSPLEYTPESVGGKRVCIYTTNGTKAVRVAEELAEKVYVASFLNLSASVDILQGVGSLIIVCAGNEGRVSFEDTQLAGAIIFELKRRAAKTSDIVLSDSALVALLLWEKLGKPVFVGAHAERLKSLGFERDVDFCQRADVFDVAAQLVGDAIVRTDTSGLI